MTLEARIDLMRHFARRISAGIRIAIILVVVYAIIANFDRHQIARAFSRSQAIFMVPVVLVLTPLSILLRSLRWRALVPGGHRIPIATYLRAYLLGFLANSLLPGKLGDFLKARMICQDGVRYGGSLASAFVDRVLEGVVLLLVLSLAILAGGLPSWTRHVALWAGMAGLAVLLAMWFFFRYRSSLSVALARPLFFLSPKQKDYLASWLLNVFVGFQALTSQPRLIRAVSYSLAVWILEILAVAAFLEGFSVQVPLISGAILVLVALNFGTLVPLSPGSIGVYQLLCVFALSLWHVDRDLGFSMGLAMQAVLFLPVYAAGLIFALGRRRQITTAAKLAANRLMTRS